MNRLAIVALITGLCTSCAKAPEYVVTTDDNLIDFSQYDYRYATTEALTITNLEPAPTSYVLFPRYKLEETIDVWSEEAEAALAIARKEQDTRIKAYCLEHYDQFASLGTVIEGDPFGNVVTFYWLIDSTAQDAQAHLHDSTVAIEVRCDFLTKHYDFDRAEGLIGSLLPKEIAEVTRGPIMVLDVGFAALAMPFDNIQTENMERLPHIWKQSMEDALREAKISRTDMLGNLSAIEEEIRALEQAKNNERDRRKKRNLQGQVDEKRKEKRSLLERLFGKNSWGRAILCGFAPVAIRTAGTLIPDTGPIEAKVNRVCSNTPASPGS